ncbi:MAG: GNAT family N-acetyltransferase [Saprospiraceae bacterium]|nr:GNAT family N-acetyltransferase [Saprospiraceae bacterium]
MPEQIKITQSIDLQLITKNDCKELLELMTDVYPKSYDYFWTDGGIWYLDFIYNSENVLKELLEQNSPYFFVLLNHEKVGVLRIQYDFSYSKFPDKKASKLHRIYLHPKTHGQGIGKSLMNWTIKKCRKFGSEILWLDAMDTKIDALGFYEKFDFQVGSRVVLPYERIHLERRGMYQMWVKL